MFLKPAILLNPQRSALPLYQFRNDPFGKKIPRYQINQDQQTQNQSCSATNTVVYYILQLILFALQSLFLLTMLSCDKPEAQEPPNIIFFIADDMYPDMFNCLPEGAGKNLTPNLDRLAKEGMLMINQYVTSPVCSPSRYSCLTGKYASRANNDSFLKNTDNNQGQTVIQWNTQITGRDKALPHFLREAGYATGMVGKNHVIGTQGLHRFPDYNADPREPAIKEKIERKLPESGSRSFECGIRLCR